MPRGISLYQKIVGNADGQIDRPGDVPRAQRVEAYRRHHESVEGLFASYSGVGNGVRRPVVAVDPDGNEQQFASAAMAGRHFGISPEGIHKLIHIQRWGTRVKRWWYYADHPRPAAPPQPQRIRVAA